MSGRGKAEKTLIIERAAIAIVKEIQPCSVRAVAYKLFTLQLIDDMGRNSTNKVSGLLTRLREEGLIPWGYIVDESRGAHGWRDHVSAEAAIKEAADLYRRDAWREQPRRIRVVAEKATIRSMIQPVLRKYGAISQVMKGYGSATAMQTIAMVSASDERPLTVLYLGDHDPSGRHMSEIDFPERIARYGGKLEIVRIAIDDADAGEAAGLPAFDARTKTKDARYDWFVKRYGYRCVELDALPPPDLRSKLDAAISACTEPDAWAHSKHIEAVEINSMRQFQDSCASIFEQAGKYPPAPQA